jgi:hypothetical protein
MLSCQSWSEARPTLLGANCHNCHQLSPLALPAIWQLTMDRQWLQPLPGCMRRHTKAQAAALLALSGLWVHP